MWKVLGLDGRIYYSGFSAKLKSEFVAALKNRGTAYLIIEPENIIKPSSEPTYEHILRFDGGLFIRKIN